MTPSVGRSLGEGFRLANRSWGWMGLFMMAWLVIGTVIVVSVAVTRPPAALLEQAPAAPAPVAAPVAPAAPAATTAAPATPAVADGTVAAPAATAPAVAPAPMSAQESEQQRQAREWLTKAWPMLLICALILIVASFLIQAGQIGYAAQRLRAGQATVGEVSRYATHSFGPLLGSGALFLLAIGAIIVLAALLTSVLGKFSNAAAGIVGVALLVGLLAAGVWLSMRLALWPVAIVADHQGPIGGLKASWAVSRGRWWTLAGIAGTLLAISIGVAVALSLLEGLGSLVGNGVAAVAQVLSGVLGLVANIFISFASIGALVRFYEDAKSPAA